MSETTLSMGPQGPGMSLEPAWPLEAFEPRWERVASPLVIGLLVGALLGGAFAAWAAGPISSPFAAAPELRAAHVQRLPPLEREWRGYRTPVDIDAMFRRRR